MQKLPRDQAALRSPQASIIGNGGGRWHGWTPKRAHMRAPRPASSSSRALLPELCATISTAKLWAHRVFLHPCRPLSPVGEPLSIRPLVIPRHWLPPWTRKSVRSLESGTFWDRWVKCLSRVYQCGHVELCVRRHPAKVAHFVLPFIKHTVHLRFSIWGKTWACHSSSRTFSRPGILIIAGLTPFVISRMLGSSCTCFVRVQGLPSGSASTSVSACFHRRARCRGVDIS